ncbi:sodium:solute symporter family transporter [Paludibacterium yongneupense]|uniref:sodium:solute symporter family transporter n=1 Tax=Paludibacterium yongneupense TaxID=400061 RepID=UPI000404BD3C|nr:cation/acetate symporter ActP [Paludibacterium yongneupense]
MPTSPLAIWLFVLVVAMSLLITRRAARLSHTPQQFFRAGMRVNGWQNGLALAGDYLSAAAFLGAAGLVLAQGYDSLVYAVATLAGWPLLLLLLAEKLREQGHYTVADILARRFPQRSIRLMSALNTVLITLFYLVVQMVGSGKLIEMMFGLPYGAAVTLVGVLMTLYVGLGGMLATTWVQMLKAVLMLIAAILLASGVLAHTGWSLSRLVSETVARHPSGAAVLLPSRALGTPLEVISLALGLVLGLLGLPHVLMRFFTVADARAARVSVCWATGIIALFFTLNAVIGAGGIILVAGHPAFLDAAGKLIGGGNMVALHLARVIGGEPLMAAVAAIAFATMLAVVAGLTLAGAGAIGHDVYGVLWRKNRGGGRELLVTRLAALGLGLVAIALSTLFQQQNIAFMLGLAFALAASANFPVLLLSLFWPGLTVQGALACGIAGMVSSVFAIVTGPTVWVGLLGFAHPLFPLANPALISVGLAFAAGGLASHMTRSAVRQGNHHEH